MSGTEDIKQKIKAATEGPRHVMINFSDWAIEMASLLPITCSRTR
jgi:hypothetical protein